MPAENWVSGQTLTAAELTIITNMLPYPATAGSNVGTCVAGTFYFCTTAVTMGMPAPSAGTVIGFRCTAGAGVTINNHSAESFFSPYLSSGSATSFTLAAIGQYVVFIADGSNWYEIASGGLAGKGILAYVNLTGIGAPITATVSPGTAITGATATATVVAGRVIRVRYTGTQTTTASANVSGQIFRGASGIGMVGAQYTVGTVYSELSLEVIDTPPAGTWTWLARAWVTSGTMTPTNGAFTVEDVT